MKKKGWNPSLVRIHNQNLIIDNIIKSEQVSRAELAESLKMSKPSVSINVEQLISLGILVEKGLGNASKGRKPMLLQFNAKYGFVIGIDLSRNQIFSAISDLSGKAKKVVQGNRIDGINGYLLISEIEKHIVMILQEEKIPLNKIMAIAIASPGILTENKHIRLDLDHVNWGNTNPIKTLQNNLKVPVVIENDINTAALAEFYNLRKKEKIKNMVFISIGRGLGSGIIINEKLYKGAFGGAGEVARMSSSLVDHTLNYESFISLKYLKMKAIEQNPLYDKTSLDNGEDFLMNYVRNLLTQNDKHVKEELEKISSYISVLILNLSVVINPEVIVLGGVLMSLSDFLLPKIKEKLSSSLSFPIDIRITKDIKNIGVYGAIEMAKEKAIGQLVK